MIGFRDYSYNTKGRARKKEELGPTFSKDL